MKEKANIDWNIGMGIKWETFGGDKHEGVIYEIDSNVAHVHCVDGKDRAVEI